ncbi:hypothetical protein XANCAGTX0491_001921 [Xanthoria calcicola]
MFCSSLRQRRDLASVFPILSKANTPPLRETKLMTHDLALPLPAPRATGSDQQQWPAQRCQLFLLLTPESVSDTDRTSLLSRIERFATLTTDPSPAIAFLLFARSVQSPASNSFHAYMTLQLWLHETATTSPPILPIASPAQFLPLLNTFVAPSVPTHREPTTPSSRSLLRQITATAPACPLSEHSTNVLSDICHSIGEVATMTASEQGRQVLEDFLGEQDAKDIESFWAEEWICE